MKFLQEAIRSIKRLDAEQPPTDDQELPPEDQSIDFDDLDGLDLDLDGEDENEPDDVENPELDGEDEFPEDDENYDPATAGGGSTGGDAGGSVSGEDDFGQGDNPELDQVATAATEDPDKQGVLRTVKGAHLVYKRASGDGGFEELWMYNVGTLKDELDIRKSILAGTDIPVNRTSSEDGSQEYSIWSAGNAELIHITGLQN